MKRIIITLALLIAALLIFAYAETNVTGTWEITSVNGSDVTGFGMKFVLSEGGAGQIILGDESSAVTWSGTDNEITIYGVGDAELNLTITENTMTTDWDGEQYVFTRSDVVGENAISADESEQSAGESGTSMADFIGTWKSKSIIIYDEEFDASEYSFEMTIAISDGELTVINSEGEYTFEATCTEGVLCAGEGDDSIECFLREDGTMAFDIANEGIPMTIVMERNA